MVRAGSSLGHKQHLTFTHKEFSVEQRFLFDMQLVCPTLRSVIDLVLDFLETRIEW